MFWFRSICRSEDTWGREPEANSSLPREKKVPHSRGEWLPEAAGRQLLGGEDESEQNKHHSEFWAISAAESCLLKQDRCCAVLIPFSTDWVLRLNVQTTGCSKDTEFWFVSISFFFCIFCQYILLLWQHTKPCSFQSPCTELPEMNNQSLLMAEFLHICNTRKFSVLLSLYYCFVSCLKQATIRSLHSNWFV